MKAKRSHGLESDLNETGIFLFLTLVIFFGAVGFPTLINTSPTIGYDDDTIAKLTPVTTYYQQAFAEQRETDIISRYYFDPNIELALMVLPTTVDLPPPDMDEYFQLKHDQGIKPVNGLIEFDNTVMNNSDEMFTPKSLELENQIKLQNSQSNLTKNYYKNEPYLKSNLALGFINGIPMSWFKVYWIDDRLESEDSFNLIPKAEGAEFYVKQTDIDSVIQGGSGTSCPAVTSPSSATLGGAIWTLKRDSGDSLGCSFGIVSYDEVLLPLEMEDALAQSPDPIFWGVDFTSTAWNSADNSGSTGCRIYPVSGSLSINPDTDGRINATGAYEQIHSLTSVLLLNAGLCDSDVTERYTLVDGSNADDYINRANSTFYQVGTNVGGITGRDITDRSIPSQTTFLKYSFEVPVNNTDNFWQMQEHPMFEATFPAISTGSFENITNALRLDTGDANSEVGQVVIFKSFNKTDLGTLGDIRVVGEFEATGTTSDMNLHIEVKEGNIQAGQVQNIDDSVLGNQLGHFPTNERMLDIGLFKNLFIQKSSQNINNSLSVIDIQADSVGVIQPFDISITPYWAGSQNDVITVMVGIQDNSASGRMQLNITSIEVEDEVRYDFTDINQLWFNEPDCSTEMATGSFGLIDFDEQHINNCGVDYSNGLTQINTVSLSGVTGVANPTPDAVTGLDVTFVGDVANLTWNHPQTNVTSFRIDRDIGDGFKTLFYVPAGKLTTVDRTSQDLADPEGLFGLPRSTSITYRVVPMNGNVAGTGDTDTKTSNTISDEWQWKEYNFVPSTVVNQTILQEGGSEKRLMMNFVTDIVNRQGQGWLFKVFPRDFINNTQIEVDWEGTKTGTFTGGTLEGRIKILDGDISRFNTTQFDVTVGGMTGQTLPTLLLDFDSVDFEGAPFDGALGRETHIISPCGATCGVSDPQWDDAISDLITLAVIYHDGGGKEGNLKIASIKVDDAFYNFSNSIIITEEQNLQGNEQQNDLFDFELLDPQTQQDTGLVIPSSANVTITTPINFEVFQDGANEAELDWSDSLGADNYQVFRNGTLIASPILSEYTDSAISLGQVYEYKVRANNTEGISDNSTQIEFGLIDPIDNLVSTALSSSSIKLDWDVATTSHPTDPLIGIQITRNGTLLTTVDDLDVTYTDNSLMVETNYLYVLQGISTNSTGIGNSTNTTTLQAPPDQVTGLVITQNMTNDAELDWDDVTGADNYQILRQDNFTGNVNSTIEYREQHVAFSSSTDPFCTFNVNSDSIESEHGISGSGDCYMFKSFPFEFLNNTQIELTYETTHIGSVGGLTFGYFITVSDIPIDRNNEALFPQQGSINWLTNPYTSIDVETTLTKNGGILTRTLPDNQGDWDTEGKYVNLVFDLGDISIEFQNPTYRIYSLNITDFDTGKQKAFYNFTGSSKLDELDGLPPAGCDDANDCLRGTFTSGSLDITPTNFEEIGTSTTSNFTDITTPLTSPMQYKVRGNNTDGFGDNSTTVDFGLIQQINALESIGGGEFIGNLNATAINSTAIQLTWDQAETVHPSDPLTGVLIQSNASGTFTNVTTVDELDTSYIDNGLSTGIVYSYRLKAFSAVSSGAFGTSANATVSLNATQSETDFVAVAEEVTLISPPFPITTFVGSTVSNTCELSWSAPSDGGSPITSYNIYRSIDGASYIFLVSKVTTSHVDTGLANNVLYEYNVTALNAFGESESSNIVDCMPITVAVPSAPTILEAEEEANGDVTLTWLEPATGDPTGYRVERKIAPASFSTLVNDTGSPSLTYSDVTSDPSTEYTYRVAGWNSFGLGAYSNEEVITTASAPNAPILNAQQVGDVITVNWTQPASDNPINGYKIDRRVNLGSFTTFIANTSNTDLSITDSNVMKPNTYGYRVRALSSSGQGTVSNVVDVVFGSHVIVQVREQDGSGFKGGGTVKAFNSTFSELVGLNANSNAIFDNFATGNYNYTFIDNSDFILNKTFNFPFPSGNLTSSFTVNALVFDVDCPDNGVGTDVRIKLNYTDAKDITEYPSTPVCDSTDQVSWSTRWEGGAVNDTSIMVADFISTIFKANAEQFLASAEIIPTTYSGVNNAITSDPFQVNATDVTINFNLFLGRAPAGGGGSGSGSGSTTTSPPAITNPEVVFGQRLTGLSILSRTHQFAQAGDIIEGSITVNWEGEENLRIKEITPSNTEIDIRFDELPPFDLEQRIEGIGEFAMSTAEIPYSIILQPQECSEELGISQNCFEPILHTLPLEFKFEREGQEYEASTEVFVDGRPIPLDIVQLQIILLFLVLVVSAVFGAFIRNRFRKKTRRTKKVKKKFKKKFDSS